MNKEEKFLTSIKENDFDTFINLLRDPTFDPSFENSEAAEECAAYKRIDMLKLLSQSERIANSIYTSSNNLFIYQIFVWCFKNDATEITEDLWEDDRIIESIKKDNDINPLLLKEFRKRNATKKLKEF